MHPVLAAECKKVVPALFGLVRERPSSSYACHKAGVPARAIAIAHTARSPVMSKVGCRVLSFREALGGPWASNFSGWAILFAPSTVLVFLFNANSSQGLSVVDILVLAVVQHLAAGIVVLSLGAIIRKRFIVFPLSVSFSLWILIGITRGVAGALFFLPLVGADQFLAYRIGFWVIVAVIWMPLFVYTAAQWEHRAALASTRSLLEALRDEERAHSIEPAGDLHKRLVSAVQNAISPVIEEIKRSLSAVSTGFDPSAMRRIGDQLAEVSKDAAAIVSGSIPSHAPHPPVAHRRNTSPLSAAVDFEHRQAPFAAVLTGCMLLTIALPVGLASGSTAGLLHALIATAITTAALILRALTHRIFVPRMHRFRGLIVLIAYAFAGVLGAIAVVVLQSNTPEVENVTLVIAFPLSTVLVAALISGAVGLSTTNEKLALEIADLDQERHDLELVALVTEDRVRKDLASIMHGPVQGRLSACVMALNFHAAELEQGDPERVESITTAVLGHLEAASADLDSLGKTVLEVTRP